MQLNYCVSAQATERDGKKYALIEVIDENVSGPCEQPPATKIRINPAGKARALGSLLEKPLLGPPDLGHHATQVVGHPVDFTSNHVTSVLYEIPDPEVWQQIESGKWGPVSPLMTPTKTHYEGDTYVLDEWTWDNVAFVPKGAFSNAGVKSTCIGDPRLCGFTPQRTCGFIHAVAASLNPIPRGYNPMQPTIGDLVGVKSGASQELSNPTQQCHDSACSTLHTMLGIRCSGILCASVNPNGSSHFDPMRPTVGDLVGVKAVEVAASAPPVVRRIDGRFDPTQNTVGDLVQGHTSGKGPLAGRQKNERPRSPFLTF